MVKFSLTGTFFSICLALLVAHAESANAEPQGATKLTTADLCARTLERVEKELNLPTGILKAISLAETGWWDSKKGQSFAWPWTVTSGKWSQRFRTRDEAIDAVKRLLSRKVKNIDVGCMQVNLGYHPGAFSSLEEAFDPTSNIRYGAGFLKGLYGHKKSWARAIAAYHSSNAERGFRYRQKVQSLWRKVRVAEAVKRRQAAIKAYRERVAERGRLRQKAKNQG